MPPDSATWYVALVTMGQERAAEDHLIASGFAETFCPRRVSTSVVRGKSTETIRAVFAGYVLAATDAFSPDLWHLACPALDRPSHGLVRGFIGGWPADPVHPGSVERLRACCDDKGFWLVDIEPGLVIHPPGALLRGTCGAHLDRVFRVVLDVGNARIEVQALQNPRYVVYVSREDVEFLTEESHVPRLPSGVRRSKYGKRAKCEAVIR